MLTHKKISAAVLVLFLFVGCAQLSLTPKQTILWALNVYEAQYDLYVAQTANPDLTEEEKKILRVKKTILVDLEHSLNLATADIAADVPIDDEVQEDIKYLVNRLLEAL